MSVTDMIEQQLDPGTIQQIGQRIGADPNQTSQAISAAIPMLMAAMARNTADPDRAAGLARALDEDHDGGLLDNLAGYLNAPQGRAADGQGILRELLVSADVFIENIKPGSLDKLGFGVDAVRRWNPRLREPRSDPHR